MAEGEPKAPKGSAPAPTSIGNQYIIHDEIMGRGAWSVVKKCSTIPPYEPPLVKQSPILRERSDTIQYVVKIIEKDYLISLTKGDVDRAMMEVKREIEVLNHIPPHKYVVNFIEHFETDKHFLLIFEEVKCGDLCEMILKAPDARLEEGRAKRYIHQLVQAVLHCHVNDVIHRDIKPENLLVNPNDDIKLTDFGLAKWARGTATAAATSTTSDFARLSASFPGVDRIAGKRIVCADVIGTPRYGAPEMFYAKMSQTQYDGFKADTWSVGVVAYIILSGTFPFFSGHGSTEQETFKAIIETQLALPHHISPQAKDFLQRLLNKDPLKRMSLSEALDHPWLESEATEALHTSEAVALARAQQITDPEVILSACEREVAQLHLIVAKLRRDLQSAKWREQDFVAAGGMKSSGTHGVRRPETPPPTSRTRGSAGTPSLQPAARMMSPAGVQNRSAARVNSPVRTGSTSAAPGIPKPSVSQAPAARTASPLVRSSASAQRRGTPMRPSTTSGVTSQVPPSGAAPAAKRSTTPTAGSRAGSSASLKGTTPSATSSVQFAVGDQVIYKSFRGVVQFNGATTFGPGVWIGLEMLEGNEGTNDGTSFVDKKRYFSCPKGKGVFVRASQIKKMTEDSPADASQPSAAAAAAQ